MARNRNKREGASTASIIAAAVLLVVVVWYTGLFDKVMSFVQPGNTGSTQQVAQQPSGQQGQSVQTGYAYSKLSAADQELYKAIYAAFTTREAQSCSQTNAPQLERARDCVLADHPEIFYANNVKASTRSSGVVSETRVSGEFTYTVEDAQAASQKLEDAASACLASMPADADDYGKAKYLFEYLVTHVEYDHDLASNIDDAGAYAGQTAVDALVGGRAVCGGYAHAYEYLLQKAGIPCVYISGSAIVGSHAWCAAQLDGQWYYIDPTWGDAQFQSQSGNTSDADFINYDYFCVTTTDLSKTHTAGNSFSPPSCTSMADNYYVREDAFFESVDLVRVSSLVSKASADGGNVVRLRCANTSVYSQLASALFDGGAIFQMYAGGSYQYVKNDTMLTMMIVL